MGVISLYYAQLSLEYCVCNILVLFLWLGHGQIGGHVGEEPYDPTSNHVM